MGRFERLKTFSTLKGDAQGKTKLRDGPLKVQSGLPHLVIDHIVNFMDKEEIMRLQYFLQVDKCM